MESISSGDVVVQLRKKFGNRGDPSLQLSGDITPVANLGNIDLPPFHTKGGFSVGASIAAAVGNNTIIGLYADPAVVPPSYRAVISRLFISSPNGAANVQLGVIPFSLIVPALTQSRPVNSWDSVPNSAASNEKIRPMVTLVFSNAAGAIPALDNGLTVVAPLSPAAYIEGPYVLAPGNVLIVVMLSVNSPLVAGFYGDEYLLG